MDTQKITRPKKKRQAKKYEPTKPDVYSDPELVRIYQTLLSLEKQSALWREKCFLVRAFLGLGLRINEMRWLRIEDIAMDYPTPVVRVVVGKGGRQRQTQATPEFGPRLRQYIWKLARISKAETVEGPFNWWDWCPQPKGYLFRSFYLVMLRGEPPRAQSVWTLRRFWKDVIDQCGVRYLPPHRGGRATFITEESERVPLHKLADTAGHSLAVMEQYYRRGIPGRNYSGPDEPPMWRGVA